jgi:hypothetical protein
VLLPKIEAAVAGLEGVDGAFTGAGLQALGLPDPAVSDQAPDLVLSSKDGYEFGRADTGAAVIDIASGIHGHHGVLNSDPSMRALFLARGRDVRPGAAIGDVRAIDVAPTIAEWLGVALPGAAGRSLAAPLAGR